MKFLSRKNQDDVLKRLVAIEVIFRHLLVQIPFSEENAECMEKYVENAVEIAYLVGDLEGVGKVHNTIERLFKELDDERDMQRKNIT